jgi:NADP-dependent 3-hydroxy acid dehydrogenase YdfG
MTNKIYIRTGIGYAIARHLLGKSPPNNVILVARTKEPLIGLQKQYPDHVQIVAGDVIDHSLAEEAVKVAIEKYKRLDGMVLNHGILGQVAKIEDADLQQWAHGFNVNFFSLVAFVSGSTSQGRFHFPSLESVKIN